MTIGGKVVSRRRLIAGAAAAGGLAGCARGRPATDPLTFWQFYSPRGKNAEQTRWFKDLVAEWNRRETTKVVLKFVPSGDYRDGPVLQTAFAAGQGPDIFVVSPGDFLRYYNGGVLQDLTPYLSPDARADFYPELMATRMVGDRIYALPMGGGPLAMYYSVRAFEDAGLSEGDIPTTWESMLTVADRLNRRGMFGSLFEPVPGYFQNFNWYPFLWMAGGAVLNGKRSAFAGQSTARALRYWQEFVERGLAPRKPLGGSASDVVSNLGSGYCAMQNAGMWAVADFRSEKPDFDYDVFTLPVPEGGTYTTASGGWAFAANARGRNPDAAARFCVWAIGSMHPDSVDRVVRWCTQAQTYLPYRKSAMLRADALGAFDSGPMRRFRHEIFTDTRSEPRFPPEISKAVSDALQECQLNGADPPEQGARAAARIDAFLQTYPSTSAL